ncbi:MAG TPA: hypothetical protein VK891_07990, partial [Euzebyales bacterium]|nr:hypothetical protein [Euzebyales bacterium]
MRTQRTPVEVLKQLPAPQWDTLARAVRRAVEQLPPAQVPVGLRPFQHWHPEALRDASRARDAVALALTSDARFRAEVADAVAGTDQRDLAVSQDPLTLRAQLGDDRAIALLAVTEQYDALATLGVALADEHAQRPDAVVEQASAAPPDRAIVELQDRVRALTRRLQQVERHEADLRRRLQRVLAERDEAQASAIRARDEHRTLVERLDRERAGHRERLARLRRRVGLAERRAAAGDARLAEVSAELAALSDRLLAPRTIGEQTVPAAADRA